MSTDDPKRDDESKPEGPAKAARIAALEAELAALRAEAGSGGANDGGDPLGMGRKGAAKAIIVAILVLGVGLTLIFGLFSTLAKGFDAFADKAAKRLTPGYEDDQPQTITAKPLRGAKSVKLKKSAPSSSPASAPTTAPTATAPASPAAKPEAAAAKVPAKKPILLPGL